MTEFGRRLREHRLACRKSQKDLAEVMGMTQAAISQFEKGHRLPTPANLGRFAEVLLVPVQSLTGDTEAEFETAILMRNLKGMSPDEIRLINEIAERIRKGK